MWRRDRTSTTTWAAASVDLLKRAFAPVEQRLDAVLARERQIPRLLARRVNLEEPAARLHRDGHRAGARRRRFLPPRRAADVRARGRLPASGARRAELHASNEGVVKLAAFAEWLERDLLPRSRGDFRVGAEGFREEASTRRWSRRRSRSSCATASASCARRRTLRVVAEEVAPGRRRGGAGAARARAPDRRRAGRRDARRTTASAPSSAPNKSRRRPRARTSRSPRRPSTRAHPFASLDALGGRPPPRRATTTYAARPCVGRAPQGGAPAGQPLPTARHLDARGLPGHYYQLLKSKQQGSRVRPSARRARRGLGALLRADDARRGLRREQPQAAARAVERGASCLVVTSSASACITAGCTLWTVEFFVREGFLARTSAEREARRGTLDPTASSTRRQDGDSSPARRVAAQHGRLVPPRRVPRPLVEYGMPPGPHPPAWRCSAKAAALRRAYWRRAAKRDGAGRRAGRRGEADRLLRAGDRHDERLRGRASFGVGDGRNRAAARVGARRRRAPRPGRSQRAAAVVYQAGKPRAVTAWR